MEKERNRFVDIMRGVAMLLVVLGHTVTGCTEGAKDSFLYNIIWSLQMPLFFLISGYITRYSRGIESSADLWRYIRKRLLAYLLPWAVWSLLIRGVIFGSSDFLHVSWLLWHMDSGYWFLMSIWTISVIFGISACLAGRAVQQPGIRRTAVTLALYLAGMAVLAGIGLAAGFSFLAIKLTLYYMPFYFAGYLYGQYRDRLLETSWGPRALDAVVAVSLGAWLLILTRVRLFELQDNGMAVLLRAFASVAGCAAVCGLGKGLFTVGGGRSRGAAFLCWCGEHSLEIYLTHYLLLDLLRPEALPSVSSVQGIVLTAGNFALTTALTVLAVRLTEPSKALRLLLYGKRE